MKKILAALFAIYAAPVAAQTTNAPIRQMVPLSNPVAASQWADMVQEMSSLPPGNVAPMVLVLEGTDRYGRRITFTQLQSLYTCGPSNCASRIFINGKLDKELALCSSPENTDLSSDGTYVVSCGERIDFAPANAVP